jgi:hypothetical protein
MVKDSSEIPITRTEAGADGGAVERKDDLLRNSFYVTTCIAEVSGIVVSLFHEEVRNLYQINQ